MKRTITLLCIILDVFVVFGQNVSTYTVSSEIKTYNTLTGTTYVPNVTQAGDNQISDAITLPFTFTFGGEQYTKIKVSTNGWLTFNDTVSNSYPTNSLINAMLAKPLIMPLWDDIRVTEIPSYIVDGNGTNRIFKIQWPEVKWSKSASGSVISFQVWLYEADNSIEFLYHRNATNIASGSATVGLYDSHSTMVTLNAATWGSTNNPSAPALPENSICHTNFTTNSSLNAKPIEGRVFKFTPSSSSSSDRWWVHVYDNGLQNVSDIDNMTRYVGYYSFVTSVGGYAYGEGFKTNLSSTTGNHGWSPQGTPTSAKDYVGCPTTAQPNNADGSGGNSSINDRYKYHFRRYGLPCGFYQVKMQLLDDRAKLIIDGTDRWQGSLFAGANAANPGGVACEGGCNVEIGYLYLNETSKMELRVQENTGFTGAWLETTKLNDITYAIDVIDNNSQALCIGNKVVTMAASVPTVTAVGASGTLLNPEDVVWKYKWEQSLDGVTNWTIVPNEEEDSLSPGVTNSSMFYRRKTTLCGADAGISTFAQITYSNIGNELAQNGDQKTCLVNINDWVHFFYDPNDGNSSRLLASIHSNGQDLGNVTITSYVENTPLLVPACGDVNNPYFFTSVMNRHWVITPEHQPTSNVKIRLPFTDAEFSSLVTESGLNLNLSDNVFTINDVKLSKYSGPANVDGDVRNNCADQGGNEGTQSGFISDNNDNTSNFSISPVINVPNGKYKDFIISSFSEFWLHGSSNNSPLPITLTSFAGTCSENAIQLTWTTATETNVNHYEIYRTRDGQVWGKVAEVNAIGNSSTANHYQATDTKGVETMYYKLRSVDNDGTFEDFNPIAVKCDIKGQAWSLHPVPAETQVTITIETDKAISDNIVIMDMHGRAIQMQAVNFEVGVNYIMLDVQDFAKGTYMVKINNETEYKPLKLMKIN